VWDPVKRTMFNAKFVLAADLAKHKQVDPEEAEILDAATSREEKKEQILGGVEEAQEEEEVEREKRERKEPERLEYNHEEWEGGKEWMALGTTEGATEPLKMKEQILAEEEEEKRKENLERLKLRARAVGKVLKGRNRARGEYRLPTGMIPKTDLEADTGEDANIWLVAKTNELNRLILKGALKQVPWRDLGS